MLEMRGPDYCKGKKTDRKVSSIPRSHWPTICPLNDGDIELDAPPIPESNNRQPSFETMDLLIAANWEMNNGDSCQQY